MKYVLFDLDGTLTDPFEGITRSFQYALKAFGIEEEQSNLKKVIGPPLIDSFCDFYGFDEKTGWDAVWKYRERYEVVGWKENRLLDGVTEMLEKLSAADKKIALATAKPHFFANKILEEYEISEYFDVIVGAELDGSIGTKTQVITKALELLDVKNLDDAIMVGDRCNDILGAKDCSLKSIGVKVGYAEENELEEAGADYIVDTIEELTELLLKH